MSTATRKRQRDPFDASDIASPLAEKALVAHLLPVFRDGADAAELADARRILAAVDPAMLTEPVAADAIAAYREAIQADPPTMADISKAAQRRAEAVDGSAKEIIAFIADVGDSTDSWRAASRLADEAATEIIDAHTRRQTIVACGDAVSLVREGGAKAGQITAVIDKLAGLAALADRRDAGGRRLRVRKASEIEPKPIEWLWPRRISRGSLTIITGLPGLSKTTLTYDIAARITTGGKWPDGTGSAPRGGVILFGMEDDPEKVVVPRLMAADADLELVRIVDGAEDGRRRDDSWLTPVSIDRDLALLREQLDAFPECRVIVFDPLSQFVEAEENSNAHTRAALAPLVNMAQERGVSIVGIMHMSKKTDSMMIQRIAGASSYGQIARHIIFVGNDPDDTATGLDRRRAMIVVKNSYGPANCGQLYRVTTRSGDQPGIEWIAGTVERDAEALNPKPAGVSREYQEHRGDAVDAMRELLAGGPRPSVEVEGGLKAQGFRRRQIDYAADLLEIDKRQARGPDGRRAWMWSLRAGDAAEPDAEMPAPHDAIPASEWRPH
jgi:putative DNA primase/helicase